jgi:hypothetical protein
VITPQQQQTSPHRCLLILIIAATTPTFSFGRGKAYLITFGPHLPITSQLPSLQGCDHSNAPPRDQQQQKSPHRCPSTHHHHKYADLIIPPRPSTYLDRPSAHNQRSFLATSFPPPFCVTIVVYCCFLICIVLRLASIDLLPYGLKISVGLRSKAVDAQRVLANFVTAQFTQTSVQLSFVSPPSTCYHTD